MRFRTHLILISSLVLFCSSGYGQSVSIKEEIKSLKTYGFGKPNPVPMLSENSKIFPYHKFEEYEHLPKAKDWKVVTLENDYIKVMVLPEIGGKVWGAIEKSTGEEFLYKNEVVKFRNIAMRGPWTSGGIEFNFGIIGHHPSTATPVDYTTRTNPDGSVSCIVGSIDLPSNTKWQVEIRLEDDKAYFETNASWYNASPITESYYNWMTAAAVATDDLEFFIPGNAYVEHNGNAHAWPIDSEGRNLAMYRNNNFGPAKSYHVVGEYNDFFGGYYHNTNFGFGQWAPYEEMPGQKLWLWALSRSGGIWEDLLTDSDGQYIEFQAGRLLDQYSAGATNPIGQVGFDPYVMDRWNEIWFPYKEIGGMVDASEHGVLNVKNNEGELYVGLNALQKLDNEIRITINDIEIFGQKLNLKPMAVFSKTFPVKSTDEINVSVVGTDLRYTSNSNKNYLKRPFYSDENLKVSLAEKLFYEGTEALEFRDYQLAQEKFSELIDKDFSHRNGHLKLAELAYRRAEFEKTIDHANIVLKMDTYNSEANYMAGIAYRATKDTINALETLGWAARDIKFRTVAYAQMAEIYLGSKNYERAKRYALKALDFNTHNLNARKVLLVAARKTKDTIQFKSEIANLLEIDPLSHFAILERNSMTGEKTSLGITNEFPAETILRLALDYYSIGQVKEALELLRRIPNNPKNKLWAAYLTEDEEEKNTLLEEVSKAPIDYVFPYRIETLPVLKWASENKDSWKLSYYLAQNLFALGQTRKGEAILKALSTKPDSDIFYRFRAKMIQSATFEEKLDDHKKALSLSKDDWKVWEENIQFLLSSYNYKEAHDLSTKAFKKFPENYNIGLAHAKSSLNTGDFQQVIKILENIQLLPFEHASESRSIYERAHLALAKRYMEGKNYKNAIGLLEKAKEWPENIGVGKPYDPDERAQDFLLSKAYEALGETQKSLLSKNAVIKYTRENPSSNSLNHVFGLLALQTTEGPINIENLSSNIRSFAGKGQTKSLLALAFYEKDNSAINALKSENIVPKDVWDIAAWAVGQYSQSEKP